ncbi:transglutaminase-like domain-containing protein [Roseomonas sp. GC11]|uniref:transglutaminase-like domain-containing protein n=1 Tax=Roseomonas sp. GC11 TaxID=2950546 RepID=UPI00210A8594|nr:transglutaminase-like domain-containing protein [Roseomonas sp. GC11]MCQ4162600.1 transglutaminase-like domain-containing protein [Roseomonas sp. GC11]
MQRRRLFSASLALAGGFLSATTLPRAARAAQPVPSGWRQFEITTRIDLSDTPGAAHLWLPLAQSAGGYQAGLGLEVESQGQARLLRDARYGAGLLKVDWAAEGPKTAVVVQRVATRDRLGCDASLPVTAAEQAFWRAGTESVPLEGIVTTTAQRIVAGRDTPRAKLRALYDWVVEHTARNPETPGCGFGDVRGMLESGNLTGKCADINGLMTALARGAGFAARDVYGIRVAPSAQFRTMGASGAISKAQHCRTEVFLEGEGWFPLDPADVRKVVLDHRLAVDSPEVMALRDRLFGGWEMNWVGYNSATDIALPEAGAAQKPNFAFLMYPCAFTAAGQQDCLDPSRFRYEITAREVAA